MKLSVIIVNYNVTFFLEQCLYSVQKAMKDLQAEVIVVDNNSVDGSVEMLREKFPWVTCLANRDNRGFSRANNQAIRQAGGEYILLLNPDTVVEDDTFAKTVSFMDAHPDAGGLGVKMVDGKGRYLPESKRGLPTPAVAFYKISGLARLFPKSKTFGRYHLGYLDRDKTAEVEILSGAFMLLRKSALDKAGLLDEDFFMYGEDIDLSYRLLKAGYKNYYFPETRIIHYKGESTKKSSVNYVYVFYRAMAIFARKHFSQSNARIFSLLIHVAIFFRAALAVLNRFFAKAFLPLLDILLLSAGLLVLKNYWEHSVIFPGGGHYPVELISVAIPLYILIWLVSVYYSGGYDTPLMLMRIFQGFFVGTVVILVVYALLPEGLRFSRAIIVFGALWGFLSMLGVRILLHLFKMKKYRIGNGGNKRFAVIGSYEEAGRVAGLIRSTYSNPGLIGLVSIDGNDDSKKGFIGSLRQIRDIISIYKIDEVIYCARDIRAEDIITSMSDLQDTVAEFRIAPPGSLFIIGSKSISTSGDLFIIDINSIARKNNKRNKRLCDVLLALCFAASSPLLVFLMKRPAGFLRNIFLVLAGRRTWVGYAHSEKTGDGVLPRIRPGVLNPQDAFSHIALPGETLVNLNLLYARDYKVSGDLNIVFQGFRNLGRK